MTAPSSRPFAVPFINYTLEARILAHLNDLTKPVGSLGRLEELALRYCLARGTVEPLLERKRVVVFAGDHGIVADGVSAYPAEVTPQMVRNMLAGGAAINILARHAGAEVRVVDVGVADPLEAAEGLIRRKVRAGTRNFTREAAMTEEETREAVKVGVEQAALAAAEGVDILIAGEMGIGNTTPAAALMAALLPCDPSEAVGRGTGIDDVQLFRKAEVVAAGLERHADRLQSPLEALAAVGGLEIAGMCGLMLGGAMNRVPTIVDGFISSAAALVGIRLEPALADYLIFSHCSAETGHQRMLRELGVMPVLDLGMRLGEGTGGALALGVVEAAIRVYNEMATFSSAGVSDHDDA